MLQAISKELPVQVVTFMAGAGSVAIFFFAQRQPLPLEGGIEAPCSKLPGIFDPQGSTLYSNRSLTPQQATGNALAPGFTILPKA
jgi:hypothetical protein